MIASYGFCCTRRHNCNLAHLQAFKVPTEARYDLQCRNEAKRGHRYRYRLFWLKNASLKPRNSQIHVGLSRIGRKDFDSVHLAGQPCLSQVWKDTLYLSDRIYHQGLKTPKRKRNGREVKWVHFRQ